MWILTLSKSDGRATGHGAMTIAAGMTRHDVLKGLIETVVEGNPGFGSEQGSVVEFFYLAPNTL